LLYTKNILKTGLKALVYLLIEGIKNIHALSLGLDDSDSFEHTQVMRNQILLDAKSFYHFAYTDFVCFAEHAYDL
jgi:hypothetical protein